MFADESTVLSTQWETWGQGIVLLAAVGAALGYLFTRICTFLKATWAIARKELREAISHDTKTQFDLIHQRLDCQDVKIEKIERELSFDHGHSLKDAVFQIKRRMEKPT